VNTLESLPKAELHLHIEGTLEPEMMVQLARRNHVAIPYADAEAARAAYVFGDLQSFLDVYYAGCAVLRTERDFFELTRAYLDRASAQGVRHAEVFFDPQTHTQRGVAFEAVLEGIAAALDEAVPRLGVTSRLILCFLRHLSEEAAHEALESALPRPERIAAVGLDSSEVGNPPAKFRGVFARARAEGLLAVAHAGEEGPPSYVREALDVLRVSRIDHGIRCVEDRELLARIVEEQVPLTVCPLSNVRLRAVARMEEHPLGELLRSGALATVNSDDPAYFGGYVADNFEAAESALGLTLSEVARLARGSFAASFLPDAEKAAHIEEVDAWERAAASAAGDPGREQGPDR
jgi:adenosine deaminase